MESFARAYKGLNSKQREAVETIEGPVMVIAGPGTGKTQLISTRVGHILKKTDTLPQNILCLTYSEAGATAMRDRLSSLLGQAAYEVQISTYHAFGNELLRRNPEYFDEGELRPIDELGAINLLQEQIRRLPYGNPLKFYEEHARDVVSFISDAKRALLQPEDVMAAAEANIRFIGHISKAAEDVLDRMTTVSKKTVPIFASLQAALEEAAEKFPPPKNVLPLGRYAVDELKEALNEFSVSGSTKAITQWKNDWLAKDREGRFIFGGVEANRKLLAAGELYEKYQQALKRRRLYDYDDMILRAIETLEKNPDFKYTLAEGYSYIMLDEFQDTNLAQMRLIELLTDHPVHEGRPNVLAVGDDDQAIYAFQGADHSNMLRFIKRYRDVKIISLEENYRSSGDIISVGQNIAAQIDERLHKNFTTIDKKLKASGEKAQVKGVIAAHEFRSDAAQYEWVASEIKKLIDKDKLSPSEIAVLAPKHRFLTTLLPYLARLGVPVRYEKRENILDVPAIRQLEQMSRLVLALKSSDHDTADSLWPQVLSYDFWGLPTELIWRLSWKAREEKKPWIETLLEEKSTQQIALLFLRIKDLLSITTLEQQLDALMGVDDIAAILELPATSPFAKHYFGPKTKKEPASFVSLLSNLSLLRARLREWRADEDTPLNLGDFIDFIDAHRDANLSILDSSPYNEADSAVNIMTAYAAKGREFEAVFIISAQDNVWGSASRGQGSRIGLPANVKHIRYRGASEDERLRLLFVAATRAKTYLYFTSFSQTLAGKPSSRLKYLDTYEEDSRLLSRILPEGRREVIMDEVEALPLEVAKDYWIERHIPPLGTNLQRLVKERLDNFQLTPSHVNQFTDVTTGGPRNFFISSLLGFPPAPTPAAAYGSAVHETLRWFLTTAAKSGRKPAAAQLLERFERSLATRRLPADDFELLIERGRLSLTAWRTQHRLRKTSEDRYEYNFRSDGVFLDDVRLGGKIDWLVLDKKNKTATIIDFKTGQAYQRWDPRVIKLHRYRQQLLAYRLLVENSPRFRGYKIQKSLLEFVEPDSDGATVRLEMPYSEEEMERLKKLIKVIWQSVKKLQLPNVESYPPSTAGIRAFEDDLRGKKA